VRDKRELARLVDIAARESCFYTLLHSPETRHLSEVDMAAIRSLILHDPDDRSIDAITAPLEEDRRELAAERDRWKELFVKANRCKRRRVAYWKRYAGDSDKKWIEEMKQRARLRAQNAALVGALRGTAEHADVDGLPCWCGSTPQYRRELGLSDVEHCPMCQIARAALAAAGKEG